MSSSDVLSSARSGDLLSVIKAVQEDGEAIHSEGRHSITPLHLASLHGHLEVVQFLLDNGADVNALDDWRVAPVHNAAGAGHVDIVRELCEFGADLSIRGANKGRTPIEMAREKGKFEVIPVLQEYMSKRRANPKGEENGHEDAEGGEEESGALVIRWSETRRALLGIGDSASSSRARSSRSARFSMEKQNLEKQMRHLEKKEELHRLAKEEGKAREDMEKARVKYEQDIENTMNSVTKMQEELNILIQRRDNELANWDDKVATIADRRKRLGDQSD